jgi:hypothetical protein
MVAFEKNMEEIDPIKQILMGSLITVVDAYSFATFVSASAHRR